MRKVLHPGTRMNHAGIALASLRTLLVAKYRKAFQCIGSGDNLGWCRTVSASLLARKGNGNTRSHANAPSFLLAPAKMQREPTYTVKRVLLVPAEQRDDILVVFGVLLGWGTVVARPADSQLPSKLVSPSRLDFFQDG